MRRTQLAVGAGGIGAVLLVLLDSTTGVASSLIPVGPFVELLGNDYLFVAGLGGIAFALGLPILASGRERNLDQAQMPDPEGPVDVPAAGDDFDEIVGSIRFLVPVIGRKTRERVRARLRTAAVRTLMRTDGCDDRKATDRIERGDWTDDPDATAFLADSERDIEPLSTWISALSAGETPGQRRARRTAAAIARRDETWSEEDS